MSERSTESSSTKLVPVIIQFESAFNLGIILTESNNVVWSQLMEMHIIEKEKLSYTCGKEKPPTESNDRCEKWYVEN